MAKWQLVKLDFQGSPVHFGEVGIGLEAITERIHSDTLFSAWVSAYARLYPDRIATLFDQFPHPANSNQPKIPAFNLSSTFVYGHCQNRQCNYFSPHSTHPPIFFLPTLLHKPLGYPEVDDLKFAKAFRKLKFVPMEIWERWYQGSGFCDQDIIDLLEKNGDLGQAGTFCHRHIFEEQTLPKVSVDRIHHGTNFYHTSFTYFPAQTGIYFLFKMSEPDPILLQQLQASLELLGDEGIGGERSSGAGRFQATWHELSPTWRSIIQEESTTHNSHALISLFWDDPKICADLVANSNTRYQLQERGGWISAQSGRQLRRKNVQMFTEGSVFLKSPQGQLAIVTPQELIRKKHHPIYRSGISLSLPVTLQLP
jgi:CRISPR-associated protein Csm4